MGALALLYSAAPIGQAQAAEGLDNCDAFIALTGTISAPGTYCLKAGITSSLTSGAAITIAADNVTIDCNGHVIRDATTNEDAYGIAADRRENVTVRNCGITGFKRGIHIYEGSGHLVEENLVRNSREWGIDTWFTPNTLIRRNRVLDTAGDDPRGISAYNADVVDNTVAGVTSTVENGLAEAVFASGKGIEIRGNRVRGVAGTMAIGIYGGSSGQVISDNHVSGTGKAGIMGGNQGACVGNTATGFTTNHSSGCPSLDNL